MRVLPARFSQQFSLVPRLPALHARAALVLISGTGQAPRYSVCFRTTIYAGEELCILSFESNSE